MTTKKTRRGPRTPGPTWVGLYVKKALAWQFTVPYPIGAPELAKVIRKAYDEMVGDWPDIKRKDIENRVVPLATWLHSLAFRGKHYVEEAP